MFLSKQVPPPRSHPTGCVLHSDRNTSQRHARQGALCISRGQRTQQISCTCSKTERRTLATPQWVFPARCHHPHPQPPPAPAWTRRSASTAGGGASLHPGTPGSRQHPAPWVYGFGSCLRRPVPTEQSRCAKTNVFFSLILRPHSISFTKAQGIPKCTIGLGRGKDGRVGQGLVEGGWACVCLVDNGHIKHRAHAHALKSNAVCR